MKVLQKLNFKIDYQFRKSGPIHSSVNFPWNPLIQKPNSILDNLHQKNNNKVIINQIIKNYGNLLDCPIEIIKKINLTNKYQLSDHRKVLYFKALFQEIPKYFPKIDLTYDHMYRKYFHNKLLNNYTLNEKIFISKCVNNNKLFIEMYEREYIKYTTCKLRN